MNRFEVTIEVERATAPGSTFTAVVEADDSQWAIEEARHAVEQTFVRGDETVGAIEVRQPAPSNEAHLVSLSEETY